MAVSVVVGRDRLGIDLDVQDRRLAATPSARSKAGANSSVSLDRLAVAAEGAGVGGEVGIAQLRRD